MAPTVVSSSVGVLGPLVVKLARLLAGEYGRLKGVRREILALQCELSTMHAAMQKYTMLQDPDIQVKQWISMVRELAYDIEDSIDKFIHRLSNGGRHGGFKDFFRKTTRRLKTLGSRRGIAGQIDELKARIKQVKELKNCYRLDDAACNTTGHTVVDPRLSALFAEEEHFVGIDGPRDDLVKWMVEENKSFKQCKVLSIVGFGGLGKTTLANEIYRKNEGDFHCRAFVSVSQKPDIKNIIKDVISQVSSQDGSTRDTGAWDEKKCIAKLRDQLQDKRYLVIIDDVWSTQAWTTIKCAFPENNYSSRIIATTRIIDVAKSCCPRFDDRVYEMEALSDLHSRRLFFRRIFGCNDHCPDTLKEVSGEILKKCGGLPLAIISISSLLANKSALKDEWEKVKRSICYALENDKSLEGMNSILSLSYNDLPSNLKTCLLYLSVFPEDYVIDRERLVRRWIAEGFISEERGHSQQEVAENYFYELINKSMVQPVGIGYDGKVRACRVHDMMLQIIVSKSAEDNFITVVGGGQMNLTNRHGFIRRLSVQHIDQELASELANRDLRHVRSLTVTSPSSMKYFPGLGEFEALRILDFEGCDGLEEYDMRNIDKLFQLKFVSFRGTDISKLPTKIGKLHDLNTLDVRGTTIRELPAGIIQLTKLQYLLTGERCKVPHGIGNMRSLRVISTPFDITKCSLDGLEELGNLTRLNGLCLWMDGRDGHKRHEETLLSSLCKLNSCKLQCLFIGGGDGLLNFIDSWSPPPSFLQIFYMFGDIFLPSVPKWISAGLTNLTHLDMNLIELREGDMHTLGELPSLLILELSMNTGPKEKLTVIGFPCLKKFKLLGVDGTYVTFTKGGMPKLEKVKLPFDVSMTKTHGLYLGIQHLPCLKQIDVWLCNEGATNSESKAAAAAIRNEAGVHPNHPKVTILFEPHDEDNEEAGNNEEQEN